MHLFDGHTHFFSRTFYEVQARGVPGGDAEALLDRIRRGGIEVPDSDTAQHRDRVIRNMVEYGVERAVTFASVPEEMEIVGEAAATSDGRLVPYTVVNPKIPQTLARLESCQDRFHFRGMVLFPAMHDYGIGDDVAKPALDLALAHDMVIFVHCGLLRVPIRSVLGLDPDFPLDRGHPQDLIPVAQSRRDQTFIVPHFGGGFFDEFLRLGKACPNVYADTAGSNSWGMFQAPPLYLEDLYEETIEVFGIERVLYGSDSGGFPRGYRKDVLEAQMRAMQDVGLGAADQSLILGGNLAKLLEL